MFFRRISVCGYWSDLTAGALLIVCLAVVGGCQSSAYRDESKPVQAQRVRPIASTPEDMEQSRPDGQEALEIRVFPAEGQGGRVLVVLVNRAEEPLGIDRHLKGVLLESHTSLWAEVTNAETGEPAGPVALFKRAHRAWQSGDVLSLESGQCYGGSVDLANTFALKDGQTYKVRFHYRSLTPAKVGEVSVWTGSAKSSEITVRT